MTVFTPTIVQYDTSGEYDLFLYGLVTQGGLSPKGDNIYVVLHEDPSQSLFIPRQTSHTSRRVFVNGWDMSTLRLAAESIDTYKSAELLLNPRFNDYAHFILWESQETMLVIPVPELLRKTASLSPQAIQREVQRLTRQSRGGF